METAIRIPHAPSPPLPKLAELLAPFHVHFRRSEGPAALERHLTVRHFTQIDTVAVCFFASVSMEVDQPPFFQVRKT
jgi:hypothetical protein